MNSFLAIISVIVGVFAFFVVKRKYASPEKSLKNCALNISLYPLRLLKLGPFKHGKIGIENSIKYAMKKTKLTDFGPGGENLVKTYNSVLNSEHTKKEEFHNLGYISANIELNMTITRRLMMVQYLKENPQILNIPIKSPVFVMGLPRTGTTFLHRLLSLDPKVRAPTTWELLNPVPKVNSNDKTSLEIDADAFEKDRQKRRKFVTKILETRKSTGDSAIAHIHEVGADLPEECLLCLSDNLPCLPMLLYDCYMNVDAFLANDSTPAYIDYKKYLQLLTFQSNQGSDPKRWMLKCPIHVFYTKELAKVFPDAKLIWNHRHPVSAVTSLCSLLKAFHQLYYEPYCRDDSVLGKMVKLVSARYLEQTPKDIKECGLDSANIVYNDLVKDPVSVVKSIYKQFGWEYSTEYDTILKKYVKKNNEEREALKKNKSTEALHTYSPEEFGLTAEELTNDKQFADYIKAFNVPPSKN